MRNCGNCANYNHERLCHTDVCGKCFVEGTNGKCGTPSKWKPKPLTNGDRIRAMTDEEKAREFVFFCPTDAVFRGEDTYGKPHYTGLDGKYYSTSEEVIAANLKWLKQPAKEDT